MTPCNVPTLRVLAAVLLIDPADPQDAEDLEAAGTLLARQVVREPSAARSPPPERRHRHVVR